jgi:hypothetical protein
MAEAIGLAASVIAVLQLSDQVIRVTRRYIACVRSAKSDIEAFEKEVSSLKRVLEELGAFLKQTERSRLGSPLPEGVNPLWTIVIRPWKVFFKNWKRRQGRLANGSASVVVFCEKSYSGHFKRRKWRV